MNKKIKQITFTVFYWLWSLTWGCLMTWIGLIVALALLITGHKPYRFGHTFYFKVGKNWGGVSLGAIFICSNTDEYTPLLCHEAGHGLQQLILGNLHLFVVCIPSAIWYWYLTLKYYRKGLYPPMDYDSFFIEGNATRIGTKFYKNMWDI